MGGSALGQGQLESLLGDVRPPLPAPALFDKSKARSLVQMPCRVQALEGPEVGPGVSVGATEVHGGADASMAYALPMQRVGHDEPAQMRPLVCRMHTVDGERAFDAP